jgi:hypothetical protein
MIVEMHRNYHDEEMRIYLKENSLVMNTTTIHIHLYDKDMKSMLDLIETNYLYLTIKFCHQQIFDNLRIIIIICMKI